MVLFDWLIDLLIECLFVFRSIDWLIDCRCRMKSPKWSRQTWRGTRAVRINDLGAFRIIAEEAVPVLSVAAAGEVARDVVGENLSAAVEEVREERSDYPRSLLFPFISPCTRRGFCCLTFVESEVVLRSRIFFFKPIYPTVFWGSIFVACNLSVDSRIDWLICWFNAVLSEIVYDHGLQKQNLVSWNKKEFFLSLISL